MKKTLRILLAIGLCWCILVEVANAFAWHNFGMNLDGDWFLLIAASSASEMKEFFRLYAMPITLGLAAIFVLGLVATLLALFARGRVWWGFVCVVVAYVVWSCYTPNRFLHWQPVYLIYDTVRGTAAYAELIAASRLPPDLLEAEEKNIRNPEARKRRNLVVVIGESMTTDRMSLYGYAKSTTPCLDALRDQLTVLPPVRPNFPDTVRSLRMMFTRASASDPTHARETSAVAFRKLGYHVSFIGGQPKWGRYSGVEHLVFGACNTRLYINEGRVQPDEVLVDYMKREIAFLRDEPYVIFIQLNGSHFEPRHRVPPWFETPEGLDDYDRSVRYTDSILGAMISALPSHTTFVYLSDHGETPDAPHWRYPTSPSLWRVPLVIYPRLAPSTETPNPNTFDLSALTTLDQVFDLLLYLSALP